MSVAPATRALARLAWRELRHRPRRSLLVIVLVALPVAALTVAAVLVASSTAQHDARRSVLGGADAVVLLGHGAAADGDDVAADYLRRLPAGSRVLRVRERAARVPGVRGSEVFVEVSDLPLDDPLTAGMTKLLRGRPPAGPGEVAAPPTILRDLGLRLGDTLVSRRLGLRARITAEVIDPTDLARHRVITGAPLPHSTGTRLLVAIPPGAAASAIARLRGPGREVFGAADCCPFVVGVDDRRLARQAILAISGIALLVVGLVVGAAFAIGARRQLRVIGLLSAAAGADERHVRRLAVLQGTLCGGAGVIAGFALGVVALLIASSIDDVANPVTGRVTVPPVELALIAAMAIAATAAGAWLPGRTAARIPVLAALGGRHPVRALPATLPVRGLATSALGTALLAVALNGDSPWGLSLVGAVLIVLGFVLCAPPLVAVLEPLAARARGTTRLAARDIARQRARTGPLVAAILAVASLALLGSTIIRAEEARSGDPNDFGIGPDQVLLSTSPAFSPQHEPAAVPAQLRARVRALLPRATEAPIGFDERLAADGVSEGAVVQRLHPDDESSGVAIGGPQLLEVLGATAGRAALDRGEVVVLRTGLIEDGHVRIAVPGARGGVRDVRVAASEARVDRPQRQLFASLVVSPQAAARLGLTPTVTDVVFRAPKALTADQRRALQAQAFSFDRGASPEADAGIRVAGKPRPAQTSGTIATLLAIAAALTLAVVAGGLALSAAEGKADDTMLVALGADPSTRRRLRATQAGLLVGIGGLLAVPAGLIPAAVIILQGTDIEGNELHFAVPWAAIAVVLLALPAAAAAGAWLLTRPARWSPPATWAD